MITEKNSRKLTPILLLLLTAMSLFFFLHLHPTVIISGDDWGNLTVSRGLYPQWGIANPIKVMPEVGYPLFATLSTTLIMPLGFGFLESFSIITAIFISLLLTFFCHQLLLLLKIGLKANFYRAFILTILAYSLFFFLFNEAGNHKSLYMLWEVNITCFYHYIAPALINSILAIYIIRKKDMLSIVDFKKNGFAFCLIIFLISYIAIFSSLFANVIIAVTCGVLLLFAFIENSFSIKKTIQKCPLHILIILIWLIAVVFEANGGRASSLGTGSLDIEGSVKIFNDLLSQVQPIFIYSGSFLILAGLAISTYICINSTNKNNAKTFFICFLSGILTLVALILLCSRAGSYYAARPVVMWGIFLFCLVCVLISIDFLSRKTSKGTNLFLTIVVCLMVYFNVTKDSTLQESINLNLNYKEGITVSQYIIDKVVEAEKNNQKNLILAVPKGDDNDNWPFPLYEGPFISKALKKHDLIKNDIYIEVKPDPSLNKKMSVPLN
ncbi:MAG: hypothetical protein KIB03_07900 [Citrobacter freundii]|nr:hypothetical protein [Citrobacter freundii]